MAKRIRAYREKRGWSQAELAERANVRRPHLARLEAGLHDPRLTVVLRIARALRVPVGKLVE
jgi:transcriptional regulator with XRE-family HTH domain